MSKGLHHTTIGQLRRHLELIGTGHDDKPVAVLCDNGKVQYLSGCSSLGDRLLFEPADTPKNDSK
jgi:hypothetical protein